MFIIEGKNMKDNFNDNLSNDIQDKIMDEPNDSITYTPTNNQVGNLYRNSVKANVSEENEEFTRPEPRKVHENKFGMIIGLIAILLGLVIILGGGYLLIAKFLL